MGDKARRLTDIEAATTRLIGIGKSLPNAADREAVGRVLAELENVERAARWNGDVASTWSAHIRRLRALLDEGTDNLVARDFGGRDGLVEDAAWLEGWIARAVAELGPPPQGDGLMQATVSRESYGGTQRCPTHHKLTPKGTPCPVCEEADGA